MKKIFITRRIPQKAVDFLSESFEVDYNDSDSMLPKEELIERVKGKDGVLCLLTDNIDSDVISSASKQCKIFANYAVGYNNIDVKAASSEGIIVTNTPGVLDDATADLAWALLFSTARRVVEADRYVRDGKFDSWKATLFLGMDISKKTMGVVGSGRIGTNFAKKAKAFGMDIIYTSRHRSESFESETGGRYVSKDEIFRESDFVSLHVPLTEQTRHYVSEREFTMMKSSAVLINTARGPVVDEKALVKALESGQIWAAGLDVFENEPQIEKELYSMDNVVLLPHIGSATVGTREEMGMIAARNIANVLDGKAPETCVNPHILA